MSLLAVDVGAGTQDILLYQEDVPLEGSTKMVLPSQTVTGGKQDKPGQDGGKRCVLAWADDGRRSLRTAR